MQNNSEQLAADLQRVAHELEGLLKAKAESMAERAGDAARTARARVEETRERVTEMGEDLREQVARRAKATDEFVRSNPWLAAGIGAAVGFLVGAIAARRD